MLAACAGFRGCYAATRYVRIVRALAACVAARKGRCPLAVRFYMQNGRCLFCPLAIANGWRPPRRTLQLGLPS